MYIQNSCLYIMHMERFISTSYISIYISRLKRQTYETYQLPYQHHLEVSMTIQKQSMGRTIYLYLLIDPIKRSHSYG